MNRRGLCSLMVVVCLVMGPGIEVNAKNGMPNQEKNRGLLLAMEVSPITAPTPTLEVTPSIAPTPAVEVTPSVAPTPKIDVGQPTTGSPMPTVTPTGTPTVTPEPTVTPIEIELLYVKKSFTLAEKQTRKLYYETDREIGEEALEWSSSDTSVATVNQEGVVKGKTEGEADITLESPDGAGFVTVTVKVTTRREGTNYSESGMDIVGINSAKYTYTGMADDILQLEETYGDRIHVEILGTTYDNRNLYALVLGNPDAEKKVLVQSTIHAREYMASMLTMRQLELYCKNYYTGTYKGKYFSELFDEVAICVLPMMNPDGVTISQYGVDKIKSPELKKNLLKMRDRYGRGRDSYFTTWKANARGVDLNRNFDAYWSIARNGKGYSNAELYRGKTAESEKESKVLVNYFNEIQPEASISYHAMGSILYWNYGQSGDQLKKSKELRDTVNSFTNYSLVQGFTKYQCGGFSDWVSIKKKTPALTIEIGRIGCPLSLSQFPSIWSKNKLVLVATADLYQ